MNTYRVGINPYFSGKLAKDAPDQVWSAFNNAFQHTDLTLTELATTIRQGHALTALTRGKRKTENFISRQDLGADFDTEDERSDLNTLQTNPFIAQYAALLHTTTSHRPDAPRARALFLLERPICDPDRYREYAQALTWHLGASDPLCFDPARVWFGALGCEARTLGNVLPVAVMDELVRHWKEAQPAPTTTPTLAPTRDAHELLDQALREGRAGNRNSTGFWLARQLRDAGYTIDAAREVMLDFQAAVERLGNHPYLVREATDSLASAYSHRPRVDAIIDAVENAVIAGEIRVSANVQKTLFGALSIMRKANKTKNVALSLRAVERESFVDKSTVANHLADLVEDGILEVTRKSNHRGGTAYSLIQTRAPAKVGHSQQGAPPTALSVQLLPVCAHHYTELQTEPICAINAQIHPHLARNEGELHHSFGASVQRILAYLRTLPDGVDDLETLQEATRLSERTVRNKVNFLEAHGIVETVKAGARRRVKLARFWCENIEAITPALTTYGQDLLRAERAAKQQIAHHEHMAAYTADEKKKELSEATIQRARLVIGTLKAHKGEAMLTRRQWMQENGQNPKDAPPLSLHPRSNPKVRRPVIHVNGRDLTPGERAITKPNRPQQTPAPPVAPPAPSYAPAVGDVLIQHAKRICVTRLADEKVIFEVSNLGVREGEFSLPVDSFTAQVWGSRPRLERQGVPI